MSSFLSRSAERVRRLFRRRMLEGQLRVTSLVDFDDEGDASDRIAKRKFLANVLAGDGVHHLEVGIITELDDPASDLDLFVGIVEVHHRERNARITASIAGLEAAFPSADQDAVIFQSNPYGRVVWRAIRRERGQMSKIGAR